MSTTQNIIREQFNPLTRFIGEQGQITSRTHSSVSRYISCEWVDVSLPEDTAPEEKAVLHLFPVDDDKYCLQLLYMQYEGRSDPFNVQVCSLQFLPGFFDQYPAEALSANQPFRFDETTEQPFSICSQTRILLSQLQQQPALQTPIIRLLQRGETTMHLLRRALECLTIPFTACQVPACRFLAYDSEREKIQETRLIIEQHLDQPHTIRELSRLVAMNECYLKKGFKALIGKTIHEYQQDLRIAKAKSLLQQQDRSVSEVAVALGFSSISHFSTAFKKATGMKPCELLK